MPKTNINIKEFENMVIARKNQIDFDKTKKCEFEVEDLENC